MAPTNLVQTYRRAPAHAHIPWRVQYQQTRWMGGTSRGNNVCHNAFCEVRGGRAGHLLPAVTAGTSD